MGGWTTTNPLSSWQNFEDKESTLSRQKVYRYLHAINITLSAEGGDLNPTSLSIRIAQSLSKLIYLGNHYEVMM